MYYSGNFNFKRARMTVTDNGLLPFISTIDNEYSLSGTKKDILCFVLPAMQTNPDGMPLAQLNSLVKISRDRLYRILSELEQDNFIIRLKKGRSMYISANLDKLIDLNKKQEAEKNLIHQTQKLRLFGRTGK
jgi:hypothetical protein